MATVVYVLCALTSLACAALLLRGYVRERVKLLLWSGLCFVGLGVGNIFLVVDKVVVPARDLSILRSAPTLVGLAVLLYGLIWDAD